MTYDAACPGNNAVLLAFVEFLRGTDVDCKQWFHNQACPPETLKRIVLFCLFSSDSERSEKNQRRNLEVVIEVVRYLTRVCEQEPFLNIVSIVLYYYSEHSQTLRSLCGGNKDHCDVFQK